VHRFDPLRFDVAISRFGTRFFADPPAAFANIATDADATTRLLEGAGFEDVRFDDVHEPVLYGNDVDAALAFVQGFAHVGEVLAGMNDGQAPHTVERLRAMLAAHARDERGVVLGARSWLVTARRRASDLLKERVI
jgi:hypothetical protein